MIEILLYCAMALSYFMLALSFIVERDKSGPFIIFGLLIIGVFAIGGVDFVASTFQNYWLPILICMICYHIIGGLYSLLMWKIFMNKNSTKNKIKIDYGHYVQHVKNVIRTRNYKRPENSLKGQAYFDADKAENERVEKIVNETAIYSIDEFIKSEFNKHTPSNMKNKIADWILFWPIFNLKSLTVDLANVIYGFLSKFYSIVSNKSIKNTLEK